MSIYDIFQNIVKYYMIKLLLHFQIVNPKIANYIEHQCEKITFLNNFQNSYLYIKSMSQFQNLFSYYENISVHKCNCVNTEKCS